MELGKKIVLYVVKKTPMSVFVNDVPDELHGSIQLDREEIEDINSIQVSDQLKGYCYYGLDGNIKVSLKAPLLCQGEIGVLEAVESNHYGAFLHWGFEKDLFLPFSEQKAPVKKGHKVLVSIYLDKSGRLCATQKVAKMLSIEHNIKEGDIVNGIIYDINPEIGAFVAIENKYYGLILSNELMPNMSVGMKVTGRVTKVRDDGKMNMTINKHIEVQMDEDSRRIYEELKENEGFLPYHDKSDSETIKRVFNMSKKAFKRAIGKLYKEKRITISEKGIHLNEED